MDSNDGRGLNVFVDVEDRLWGHPSGVLGFVGGLLMSRFDRRLVDATVSALELDGSERVLEVGFGPGVGIAALVAELGEGSVVGLDPSSTMHRQATRRNRAAIDAGRATLVRGDATAMPFEDGSFDVVVAMNTVHHWSDARVGLCECRRVLGDAGTLVVASTTHVLDAAAVDERGLSERVVASGFSTPRAQRVDAGVLLVSTAVESDSQASASLPGEDVASTR